MEQQHRLCYISRNYYNLTAAGNKAKADNEDTLAEMGAVNLGLQRSVRNSKILAFFIDLAGIIRACLLLKRAIPCSCNILSRNTLRSCAESQK